MPELARQFDRQALDNVLNRWITVRGRALGAPGRETLKWLVAEAGFRRTTVPLGSSPFPIDRRSLRERIQNLADDGAIRIYGIIRGRHGGIDLKVRDLFAIHEYRMSERDRSRWLLLAIDDDDQASTIPISGEINARVNLQKPSHLAETETDSASGNARVCAQRTSHLGVPASSDDGLNARVCAQKPSHLISSGASLPLAESIARELSSDQIEVWLTPIRIVLADRAEIYLPDEFKCGWVAQRLGPQIRRAARQAGFDRVSFGTDSSLADPPCWEINARVSAQKPSHLGAQERKKDLEGNPSRVSFQEDKQVSRPPAAENGGGQTESASAADADDLVERAAALYQRIGDPGLWKWVALAAELLVDDGALEAATLERIAAEHPADFGSAIKAAAGGRWLRPRALKSRLAKRGITWKRQWESGLERKP